MTPNEKHYSERDIEVEVVRTKLKAPDPNCNVCHGTGSNAGLVCLCTVEFLPSVKETRKVKVTRTQNGGAIIEGL